MKRSIGVLLIGILLLSVAVVFATESYRITKFKAYEQGKGVYVRGEIRDGIKLVKETLEVNAFCKHDEITYKVGSDVTSTGKFVIRNKSMDCKRKDMAWVMIGDSKSREIRIAKHKSSSPVVITPPPVECVKSCDCGWTLEEDMCTKEVITYEEPVCQEGYTLIGHMCKKKHSFDRFPFCEEGVMQHHGFHDWECKVTTTQTTTPNCVYVS